MHGRVGDETRVPAPSAWKYAGAPPLGNRIGVALSGGGIRSASFGLGAVQYLQHAGLLGRVRYLSTVSGGSYIGAAVACANTMSAADTLEVDEAAPWARASLEEEYLRKNLGYLAPGSGGRIWFGANVLYGLVLNLLPLLCASFLIGRFLGVLYLALHAELDRGDLERGVIGVAAVLLLAVAVIATAVVGSRRLAESCLGRHAATSPAPDADDGRRGGHVDLSARILSVVVTVGGLVAVVLIVIPTATIALAAMFDAVGLRDPDVAGVDRALQRVAMGSLLIALALTLGGVAMLLLRLHRLPRLAFLLALLAGPLIISTPCLLAIESTSARGWQGARELPLVLTCAAIVGVFAFFVHNRRYSMHLFYRERLSYAFFLARGDQRTATSRPGRSRTARGSSCRTSTPRSGSAGWRSQSCSWARPSTPTIGGCRSATTPRRSCSAASAAVARPSAGWTRPSSKSRASLAGPISRCRR